MDDLLADQAEIHPEEFNGIAAGTMFVLCGDDVELQPGFQSTKHLLALREDQTLHANKPGVALDDDEHVARAMNGLEEFLSTHRNGGDHLQQQEMLREQMETRGAMKETLADDSVSQMTMLLRIVLMQLQQCFIFISWGWPWPELLIDPRRWIGSLVLSSRNTATASGVAVPV